MRTALANLRKFARAHRRGGVIIALDKNECPIGELEKATGLTWHGIGRDGFLSNLRLSDPRRLPIRYSDHHPVVVTII